MIKENAIATFWLGMGLTIGQVLFLTFVLVVNVLKQPDFRVMAYALVAIEVVVTIIGIVMMIYGIRELTR